MHEAAPRAIKCYKNWNKSTTIQTHLEWISSKLTINDWPNNMALINFLHSHISVKNHRLYTKVTDSIIFPSSITIIFHFHIFYVIVDKYLEMDYYEIFQTILGRFKYNLF